MSMCKTCCKDSKDHSEKLWRLHLKNEICEWCGENTKKHSMKLWEIHQETIPKGEKIVPILLGFGKMQPAKMVKWNTTNDSSHKIEYIPVHMNCSSCSRAMGSTEEDLADVLDQNCLECFCGQTNQEYTWHSKPWWAVNGGKYKEEMNKK